MFWKLGAEHAQHPGRSWTLWAGKSAALGTGSGCPPRPPVPPGLWQAPSRSLPRWFSLGHVFCLKVGSSWSARSGGWTRWSRVFLLARSLLPRLWTLTFPRVWKSSVRSVVSPVLTAAPGRGSTHILSWGVPKQVVSSLSTRMSLPQFGCFTLRGVKHFEKFKKLITKALCRCS